MRFDTSQPPPSPSRVEINLDPTVPGARLCQENVGALVTDGANAVCDRFAGTPSIAVALGLTVAAALAWRASARWRERLVAATVVLSLPGMVALAARRADAGATAARLAVLERAIEDEASATGCAPQTFACAACEPIARYARARVAACRSASGPTSPSAPPSTSSARADQGACDEADHDLVCGGL